MMVLVLQSVETAAILIGLAFALIQLRRLRIQQEVQGGAELLRSIESNEMAIMSVLLFELPDDLTGEELKAKLGNRFDSMIGLAARFEGIGPLVARGHVPIEMYEDFFRGATVLCWNKMRRYTQEQRDAGWSNLYEWFQWLAEKMQERAPLSHDKPAFERLRGWQNYADYKRLR